MKYFKLSIKIFLQLFVLLLVYKVAQSTAVNKQAWKDIQRQITYPNPDDLKLDPYLTKVTHFDDEAKLEYAKKIYYTYDRHWMGFDPNENR